MEAACPSQSWISTITAFNGCTSVSCAISVKLNQVCLLYMADVLFDSSVLPYLRE